MIGTPSLRNATSSLTSSYGVQVRGLRIDGLVSQECSIKSATQNPSRLKTSESTPYKVDPLPAVEPLRLRTTAVLIVVF